MGAVSRSDLRRRLGPSAAVVGGVVAVLVILLVALVGRSSDSNDGAGGVAADGEAPGVSHVHGLGVDPGDGTLFAATHYGTFRILREGAAERVGDSLQDTMGFTVVGPNHFLGSGHPDVEGLQAGQPGLLGLIESTDGGAT
jgi:hypothetical protein